MDDLIALLKDVPGGWLLAIFLLLVFGPLAVLSKTAAEKFGLFGVIARWWRNRPLERIEQQDRQVAAEVAVLERRVKVLEDHIKTLQAEQTKERKEYLAAAAEDRRQWREALDAAEREISDVRQGLRARDKSVLALYDWSIQARAGALAGGVHLPPIPELTLLSVSDDTEPRSLPPHPPDLD